jgi:ABC-type branched-subunit amino acid transport system ATPase component/branched-subunit amino acid ABC-type transport system permease component
MNLGTFVLGLLNGLTVGLLAVGLVLVYKSNRFLNLAHAQLGTLSALLLAKVVLDWHWNWWIAFPLAIALGTGTGVVLDRYVFERMRRKTTSQLRLLLLSVGVSQVLLALTFIPQLSPDVGKVHTYPQPFDPKLQIGGVVLSGMSVLTALLVPAVVVGLAVFLRYSFLGKQIRAAASNVEAARLCGISVRRVSALSWGLAGALSAVSAVLQAPSQSTFNFSALGPYLLMLTLGAAAVGAFVSLPAALAGGVGLGLLVQVVTAETSSGAKGELAAFLAILVIVFVRGRALGRAFAVAGSAVDERPPLRIPASLRDHPLIRYRRPGTVAVSAVVALLVPLFPYFRSEAHRFLLVLVLMYALLAVAMTMLVGWGGQVSLGHFAVVGLGAYLAARWGASGWSLSALLLVVGLVCAGVLVLVGLPALKVRGLTLAVTTIGFAVIAPDWLFHQDWAGSSKPFVDVPALPIGPSLGTPRSMLGVYYVALAVLALGVASAVALRRSNVGRLVLAVRDNERASAAFGVNPATIKLAILGVSGFFAGAAGVIYADTWRVVGPTQFTADFSVALLALPVIGGLGSVGGAVGASVLLYATTFFIGPSVSGLFGDVGNSLGFQLFLAGSGQVAILLSYPSGLAGFSQDLWQSLIDRLAGRAAAELDVTAVADDGALPLVVADPAAGPTPVRSAPVASEVAPEDLPLVTSGITVRFGGVMALDEPDLVVRPGEIVGLIGPNGAGKSTLINVVSGVLRANRGSVRIFGKEVADLPADLRTAFGVARSFQDAGLFAGLTVAETLQVALARRYRTGVVSAMTGAPWVQVSELRSRRHAEELAARFGLEPWLDSLTSELSTGTRRICDLAAQVAAAPKLLLLDEPTGGVAQREAEAFGPILRQVRDELDCAVLIVEHDMPLLMNVCDRMYAMVAGGVIAEGTPDEIRRDPLVVASYLGADETAISRSGPVATAGARR